MNHIRVGHFLAVIFIFCTYFLNAQVSLSGTVTDAASGETLIGTTIEVLDWSTGTLTNEYGFYTLSGPSVENATIVVSYIGYKTYSIKLNLSKNERLDVKLNPDSEQLEEVVVTANSYKDRINSTEMSTTSVTPLEAKKIPALLGEVDIIKTLQLKPGISSGSEGNSGIFVRGGNQDQNLIVLDEAVVYNASHLFGFFSVFNSDAIKDVKVYKGGFPSQYGGRLSSVIDVKLKEGNNQKFSGTGGIGLISSRLTLEGPIQKEKSSFIISGRRTYVDLITNSINSANKNKENYNQIPAYHFYDLNTKINFELGKKDRLFLSGYFGRDAFAFSNGNFDFNFYWGNATGTARWNHIFNDKLFSNTTFTYSDYKYNINNKLTGFSFDLKSRIQDANIKSDFYYSPNSQHLIRAGFSATHHKFTVGRLQAGSDDGTIKFGSGLYPEGAELGLYAMDDYSFDQNLKINWGIRLSSFIHKDKTYFNFEPRAGAKYSLNENLSLKASYAKMVQYIHLISNSGVTLPTDIWYPSTKNVAPEISHQVAAGYNYILGDGYLLGHEFYYKWLKNQIDFKDNARLFANNNIEEEFAFGDGYSYGTEIELEKNTGKLTGWIGYTLALVKRGNFPNIMSGRYFSPRYDRRHNLTVVVMYQLTKKWNLSATFVYGSGDLTWLPIGKFSFQDVDGTQINFITPSYGDRNSFRMPSYNRLDVGFVRTFKHRWGESDLTFSAYNVYNRRNVYFYYTDIEFKDVTQGGVTIKVPSKVALKQVSLFPIIPSITWNFKF
jgi:outer membrane receptor for ferrienterochelin and colicin